MDIANISIDTIGLSVRSANALHRLGVHTVGDMVQYDEQRLLEARNLGQKSVKEIVGKIEEYKALAASGEVTEGPAQEPIPEDVHAWLDSEVGKDQTLQWLRENQIRIDELELLSAKAYNLLSINGREYLHQLAFRTKEDLQKIPRVDIVTAAEIVKWTDAYICENAGKIRGEAQGEPELPLEIMRFTPAYQSAILEYVQKNDIPVESMELPNRPKNQLQKNGYHKLSDVIFLTEEELKRLPAMGGLSVEQIRTAIDAYFNKHEGRIRAYCKGDASMLWDDDAIRVKILGLYADTPFGGFSFDEMIKAMQFPDTLSQERIKKVIGSLLAEKKLEYVDYRCYRIYEAFAVYLSRCDAIEDRHKRILQQRLSGDTLEQIGLDFDVTRERIRQLVKTKSNDVRARYTAETGDRWFDEDYYWYFYETYAFDRREASAWMGIPESVWQYLDMMDVKQGKKSLENALDDTENLEIGLRLKVKNFLNRNKIFVDGVWIDKKRSELEPIVAAKFCRDEISFDRYARAFNDFLEGEEIPWDEDLYYTEAVIRTRKNRLADSRFLLWKQNELLRYYDIDSRDYTELLETLKLDVYENVEYSTAKFLREYPELMEKYGIRDQYELHNLLRKIVPEGSYHDFRCGRMPHIRFGNFDRDAAILDILIEMAPVSMPDLCARVSEEYGYEPAVIWSNYLQPFSVYYHDGFYSVDHKAMRADRMEALHRMLPDDFYYLDEVRKIYANLYPDADLEEINPYNLKFMGFIVLSKYVVQHYPSLETYCEYLLTKEDIVDLNSLRSRFTYVQMFSIKLMELKRNLDVIEFMPGQLLNFRKLERAGITKADLRGFCDAVYEFVPDGAYFNAQTLRADGFESNLYDLGFGDWFYANLLASDGRFSYTNVYGNLMLYKGKLDVSIQSFLVDRISTCGWIDMYDLLAELTNRYGCKPQERSDIVYRLKNSRVYHDKILDRLYANVDLYYRDLDEGGAC